MKKYIGWIIIIVVIAALAIAGLIGKSYMDEKKQNNLLTSEINALSETNTNVEVKSQGQYGIIEKNVKEAYKQYIDSVKTIRENYEKLAQTKVINLDNYKNDGPEFTNSLGTLTQIKEDNAKLIADLESLVDEAKLDEQIANQGLEEKYAGIYKDILSQIKLKEGIESIKTADEKYSKYNDSLIAVLTYMKDNKDEWFVENGELKSKSQKFIDEYNNMVKETNVEL